jgi:hypothetical protein
MASKLGRKIRETARRVGRLFNRGRKKVGRSMKALQKRVENSNIFNKNKIQGVNGMSEMEQLTAKISAQTYKQNREPFIENFELQDRGSDTTTAVYLDKQTNHLVIGYRGTKSIQDVITDYELGRGNELDTKRFQKDLENYDEIVNLYNPSQITLTGHSLGSAICFNINALKGNVNEVIVFNPAFNLNEIKRNFKKFNQNNITIIRTAADPISILAPVFSKAVVKTLQLDGNQNLIQIHSIDNFVR